MNADNWISNAHQYDRASTEPITFDPPKVVPCKFAPLDTVGMSDPKLGVCPFCGRRMEEHADA